jgi:hypothetical protein
MIFSCPDGVLANSPNVRFKGEDGEALAIYEAVTSENQPSFQFDFEAEAGEKAEIQPRPVDLAEDFDWSSPKLNREFIRLEQKFLAKKATSEEIERFRTMKADRDSLIFSERYVNDYAEIRRLKILTEKIAEIQKYLRPIKMG